MPTAEALFERVLLPLYPPDAKADLAKARSTDANPANNPSVLAHLVDAADVFQKNAPALLGVDLDFSDASVHRLSAALDPKKLEADLAMAIIHGSAYVGECIVRNHGGTWLIRRPLWESLVRLESRAGRADLAILQWWIKSLADGADATLADRYRTHVEVPCAKPESLPVMGSRKLPRITKVRYDVLHKTLKAHLPELRDLGRDFPSPERFAAYNFRWLDFLWLGGGRMLLLYGLGDGGLHLFWLTSAGFEKSALIPCENFPEPIARLEDDKLVCIVSRNSKLQRHEMLWWGP
jgi:hypothetical protein